MKSKPGIMEFLWLIIAIASFIIGIYLAYKDGLKRAYIFFIFVVISLIMFLIRRELRKKG